MKIGILTFHWAQNYGAVLQCYALKSKLEELGHQVYIIDRVPQYQGILRDVYHRVSFKHFWSWWKFRHFNREYLIPKTRRYPTMEALALHFASEKLDAVVVGSDQVWRWGMMGYNYFLDFVDAKTTRKYAYAASFGLSHWTDNGLSTAQVARLLAEFSDISVRERSGVTLCKRIFGVEATQVIDPTLLYDADFYEERLLKDFPRKKGIQVVSCILGKENQEQCKKISRWADEHGLSYIELYHTSCTFPDLIQSEVRCLHLSVQEWLEHIRSAEYVVTNSFHCTVFSILFRKKFVVLDNYSGGTDRIRTLLDALQMGDRFLPSMSGLNFLREKLDTGIDYPAVEERLRVCRKDSLAFLKRI